MRYLLILLALAGTMAGQTRIRPQQIAGGAASVQRTRIVGEVLTGSGLVYTLAHIPTPGSLVVFRNGIRQSGNAYYLTGKTLTFLFAWQYGASEESRNLISGVIVDYEVKQ